MILSQTELAADLANLKSEVVNVIRQIISHSDKLQLLLGAIQKHPHTAEQPPAIPEKPEKPTKADRSKATPAIPADTKSQFPI